MPTRAPRSRRRPASPKTSLERVVPQLAPETLQALIRHRGPENSGDLVAAATPEQLTAIFDIDLWRPTQSGRDERFDGDRFGEWLEALVDSSELLAARTIATLDEDLVIAGISRYVRIFDPAALATPITDDGERDWDSASFSGLSREVGGYVVRARRSDAWDAIVALLCALEEHHPERFHIIMRECRSLSNSKREIDGLDDLLTEPEQRLHDAAAERDRRRSQLGYVTPADARAFLQAARSRDRPAGAASFLNPIPGKRPRALLAGTVAESACPTRLERRPVVDTDEAAERRRELAFLANVLIAGCSVQSRAFTPQEASEGAVAICNLGLESWPTPDGFLPPANLMTAFAAGWAVLHELSMLVARQLIDALTDLRCVDHEIQEGLHSLEQELIRQCENRTPWLVRDSLDVIAMIDMPVWVSLQALLDECPVLPEAVMAVLERRTGAISPTAFEFISTERQVRMVRDFAAQLLESLMR